MEKWTEAFFKYAAAGVIAIATIAFVAIITAFPVKWCWNATMPDIFSLPEIGFVKAFCLTWLAGAFVKASPNSK